MINVNGKPHEWWEGMTIKQLLSNLNYTYPVLIVILNEEHIIAEIYDKTIIEDESDIKIIHPVCGG